MFVASLVAQLHTNFGIRNSHRSWMRISRTEVPRNSVDASCGRRVRRSPPPTQKARSHPYSPSSHRAWCSCITACDLQARAIPISEVPCGTRHVHGAPLKSRKSRIRLAMHPENSVQMPCTVFPPEARNLDKDTDRNCQLIPPV